jgi:hypothetical protein
MLNTISQTRDITVKRVYTRVLEGDLNVEQSMRLIAALNEEYELMVDSMKRWERTCFSLTDNKTMIMGGGLK